MEPMDAKTEQARCAELEAELQSSRDRNAALRLQIVNLQQQLAEVQRQLQAERAIGSRKQDKIHKYEQVAQMEQAGVTPEEGIKRLNMPSATYYRYRKKYLASLSGTDGES